MWVRFKRSLLTRSKSNDFKSSKIIRNQSERQFGRTNQWIAQTWKSFLQRNHSKQKQRALNELQLGSFKLEAFRTSLAVDSDSSLLNGKTSHTLFNLYIGSIKCLNQGETFALQLSSLRHIRSSVHARVYSALYKLFGVVQNLTCSTWKLFILQYFTIKNHFGRAVPTSASTVSHAHRPIVRKCTDSEGRMEVGQKEPENQRKRRG